MYHPDSSIVYLDTIDRNASLDIHHDLNEGLQHKTKYIHFVKFSGQARKLSRLWRFCIEIQTLKGILAVIKFYLVLSRESLPAGVDQGEEDFSAEKRTCVNLAIIAIALEHFKCSISQNASWMRIHERRPIGGYIHEMQLYTHIIIMLTSF